MVTPAAASALSMTLSPATGVVIAMVGAVVASVNTTGVLLPVLPAASVSCATMLLLPLPDSVTLVLQAPPLTYRRRAHLGGDAVDGVEQRDGRSDRRLSCRGADAPGDRLRHLVGALSPPC